MFYCMLLDVHSSIAIILIGKRELVALLNLSSWCLELETNEKIKAQYKTPTTNRNNNKQHKFPTSTHHFRNS